MNYITVYLYSADEQILLAALTEHFGTDEDGNILTASHDHHLVYPLSLRRETGVLLTDEEGNEYPETEPVPGYHGNLRTRSQSVVDALTAAGVVVTPNSPSVVFA